ncbi:hypothetical protein Anas_04114 [Armadillidium nasatum]|uniref:Ig-like domain-containing protein n=1 Tax=Armadillidium nasatum TaxID=96803 RepID=A0A5N5T312_9CRUS|nr:hypothetical protein Anas_04114 [Armadillidium nasatum]
MEGGNITSSSVTLHVVKEDNDNPRVLVRLGSILEASNLIEGKDAFIECVVDANPPPHRIDWFHNTSG